MTNRSRPRRMMSDINVVPYIDVMLVLLVIFMITAPLITQGVKIDLPQAPAEVIQPSEQEPIVISINAVGETFIDVGENPDQPVVTTELISRLRSILKFRPDTEVLIKGESSAPQYFESVFTFHHTRLVVAPVAVLQLARFQSPITDNQAMRDTDQLCVRKLDARTNVTIVEQDLEAHGLEFFV